MGDDSEKVRDPDLRDVAAPLPAGRIATATLIVVVIAGLAWLVLELTRFFMLVFAAIVIAAVFDAIATWLCRKAKLHRSIALAFAVTGMIALFLGAFVLFGTQLAQEFDTIRETVPRALQSLEGFLDRFGLGERARELTESGGEDLSQLASRAGGYAIAAGSGLADFVLVLVGAIFLASDPSTYRRGLLLLMPVKAEETTTRRSTILLAACEVGWWARPFHRWSSAP
jgi:predicted PurR-regulated permease PerM